MLTKVAEQKPWMNRRQFLLAAGATGCVFAPPYERAAAAARKKIKITDVKCVVVRGTWDWNLIKVETDSGLYGLGEASFGAGVKSTILNQMKPVLMGEDPLNVDKLYTKMLVHGAGTGGDIAGATATAASGIEIALWDLCGRVLDTPVCNLLGGRFRDRIRFYRTTPYAPNVEDMGSWRELVAKHRSDKRGWTAFKFQCDWIPLRADPEDKEPGHEVYARNLTNKDYDRIVRAMQTVREELGPLADMACECHWRFDVSDAIRLGRELESVKPMWLEDPVPPENPEAMQRVSRAINIPICTGENLYGRQGFRELIVRQACSGVHIDVPKSGGLLESKKISDFAEMYDIWTAFHNLSGPVATAASCHAAAAMRNFRVHEFCERVDWWEDVVVRDTPYFKNGYFTIEDKPGYGIELNPDAIKAHLAPGETWWG
jgi:L-alanine-DL-glutamate epimerase-like enolase superfamily enzyme